MTRPPPTPTLFPYTTLFRSEADAVPAQDEIDRTAEKVAGREISMITRRSPSTAGRSLASSRRLVESMPEMLTARSEEHTSELQSRGHLVCRLLLEKKKQESE